MLSKIKNFIKGKRGPGKKAEEEHEAPDEPLLDTHYDTVYLAHDAPDTLIRASYIALVRKYHPDRNIASDKTAAMMQLINASYQILSNPVKKADHDAWIAQHKPGGPARQKPKIAADDPKLVKLKADVAAWENIKAEAEKEAVKARANAADAAERAKKSSDPKWAAWAKQVAETAEAAEEKIRKAAKSAETAAAEVERYVHGQASPVLSSSPYATLKVARAAPPEVIEVAYKTLLQDYSAPARKDLPETPALLQGVETAWQTLSDPQRKAAYDARIQRAPRKSVPVHLQPRVLTPREKEAQEKADREKNLAAASKLLAERLIEEEKELRAKAEKAARDAAKAKPEEAAKWSAWVAKLESDVAALAVRAVKAKAEVVEAEARARIAAEALLTEKEWAEKSRAADIVAAEKNRALREAAEKAARGE